MDYTKQIERYIEGLMDEQEMKEFRKEMEADPELSRLVSDALRIQKTGEELFSEGLDADPADLTKDIQDRTMQDFESYRKKELTREEKEDNLRLRGALDDARRAHGDKPGERPSGRNSRLIWYAAAAILVLAVTIPLIMNSLKGHLSPDKIYGSYYTTFEHSEILIELTRTDNNLLHAIEVYESGRYSEAITLFEPFLAGGPHRETAVFYTGLCLMGTSRYHDAIGYFREVLDAGSDRLAGTARWYLGLAYLKINDVDLAVKEFTILSESDHQASGKARKVLKKIQKL